MNQEQQLLVKAEELFLRYGIKSVSMDDIARELGISKKTLYQHVENKGDLVAKIGLRFLEQEVKDCEEIHKKSTDAIDEMLKIARNVIRHLRSLSSTTMYDLKKYYRETWQLFEQHNQQHIYAYIKANIERGQAEGIYRADADADIVARLYVGKSMLVTDEDVFPLQDYQRENLFEQYIQYHIRGIASADGLKLLDKRL